MAQFSRVACVEILWFIIRDVELESWPCFRYDLSSGPLLLSELPFKDRIGASANKRDTEISLISITVERPSNAR